MWSHENDQKKKQPDFQIQKLCKHLRRLSYMIMEKQNTSLQIYNSCFNVVEEFFIFEKKILKEITVLGE